MLIDTIGHFNLIPDSIPAEGDVTITVRPIDLIAYWKRCGLMADFAAAFYSFTQDEPDIQENIISTIFNELIENASKYSIKTNGEVSIHMKLYDAVLKIQVENFTSKENYLKLYGHLKELSEADDLDELYIKTLSEKSDASSGSGIGLLLLAKDYKLKIGAQFRFNEDSNLYKVTTQSYYYIEQ